MEVNLLFLLWKDCYVLIVKECIDRTLIDVNDNLTRQIIYSNVYRTMLFSTSIIKMKNR